jgi:hypothetical protein
MVAITRSGLMAFGFFAGDFEVAEGLGAVGAGLVGGAAR